MKQIDKIEIREKSETRQIGLALSGGGSRAIAFHLGCLRALHDRGLLDKLQVISAVSGGSIIAAMYAFSRDSFESFEERVKQLLKNGLVVSIAKEMLLSPILFKIILTFGIAGFVAGFCRIIGRQPPLRRWYSRTNAFEKVLERYYFKNMNLNSERRSNFHVVINSTELRTGSAFRFGTKESGCWRYGHLGDNTIPLALAIAASAAYPVFLPAFDLIYSFDKNGVTKKNRVILSDGGIFDNLGTSCLEPGRNPLYSTNVFNPSYIIACNAGFGMFSDETIPYGFFTRIKRSFESIHRKTQDSAMKRLHDLKESGQIRGFVLAYLGQQDGSLPAIPQGFVRRDQVDYPTNFSSMTDENISLISNRGNQLIHLLLNSYCPDL